MGKGGGGQGGGVFLLRRRRTSKAQHKGRESETKSGREVGGDVTFHLATVATLDACGKAAIMCAV